MPTLTGEDVLHKAREYNVKFIRLQFTDIFGVFKNIAITVEELPRALEGRVMFDGSVIEGFVRNRESDIYLLPDPSTFVIFPWRPREGAVARLICDILAPQGEPYGACSRAVLKRALARAGRMGLEFRVGAQVEFFLFHTDAQGKPTVVTHDRAGFCDLTPVDLGENARRDMVLTLEEMGFNVSSSHHEIAPGQHEIFLKEDDALAVADTMATFKFVVRTIAQRHGLHASFMPRPLAGCNGSGMHLHQFLWRDGQNAFYDPAGEHGLSELAYRYIAGLIAHAGGLTAIANPLVNSYKRLLPTDLAPVLAAWSEENRSTMIRVPAQREGGTRVVLRSPDPTANPYLVLAVSLAAGLDGIGRGLMP
ncbi:MAG TPA: glutamine synthetase, partial [Desulfotomaculum sp.]|nr:glutamine synthetase [Desulfotomaculum sp.]